YCYNVQPGIDINYANGDSSLAVAQAQTSVAQTPAQTEPPTTQPPATQPQTQPQTQIQTEAPQQNASVNTYIINTNTGKFHYPNCRSVNQMADKNKLEYTGTRDEVIAQGYDPCGNCRP
ncbi:MAG: DNA-entry nuclease, partial [Lachnospiraceae bacterium]|nr:DNA-entry nuclease [Lachnospiraceae bacterium]